MMSTKYQVPGIIQQHSPCCSRNSAGSEAFLPLAKDSYRLRNNRTAGQSFVSLANIGTVCWRAILPLAKKIVPVANDSCRLRKIRTVGARFVALTKEPYIWPNTRYRWPIFFTVGSTVRATVDGNICTVCGRYVSLAKNFVPLARYPYC